ncbi:Cobalt-zinc-cadmium resistance protein CzcC precursor [Gimesia panareensis]|nr:Cobalt-zinc-cadmium resistance protein CzcC precursor [Gimesia panareensis]
MESDSGRTRVKITSSIAVSLLTCTLYSCAAGPAANLARKSDTPAAEKPEAAYTLSLEDEPVSAVDDLPEADTKLVAHEEPVELALSEFEAPLPPSPDSSAAEDYASLTLADLESLAQANNPTLIQADAQVEAARGAAYQAGLRLNPVMGYKSDQIGIEGTAGELQGGFVSQEFVTGGKLQLSRAKWTQQMRIAETNLQAQCTRVLNDVQTHYYRTLAAQQLLAVQNKLLANAEDNLQTHQEMFNLGQTNQAGLLQAEVDLHRARLNKQTAENDLEREWRALVAMVGTPELECTTLVGSLEPQNEPLDWNTMLNQLLECSPEIVAAWERVQHDEITVEREKVQPIPNVLVSVDFGHNYETNNSVAGVSVGLPIPIFDRNQGTVDQAQADLNQSRANVKRLELSLMSRLSNTYRDYRTSRQHVETYRDKMLPKAKQAYEVMHDSYYKRRAAWMDVLMAQKMYLNLQQDYIRSQLQSQETEVAIRGMLLTGGLNIPPAPMGSGHIDAVPKPR